MEQYYLWRIFGRIHFAPIAVCRLQYQTRSPQSDALINYRLQVIHNNCDFTHLHNRSTERRQPVCHNSHKHDAIKPSQVKSKR